MHHRYFPACPVDGPILPAVPFNHLGLVGAVPLKCSTCAYLLEGECRRGRGTVRGYLNLDHGPCDVVGPTDPVPYEDRYVRAKVTIPRKCAGCAHLVIDRYRGFACGKDPEIWGWFRRGLDWGYWRPDRPYLVLPEPKVTTRAMVDAVFDDDLVAFVRESRRANPDVSIAETQRDFADLRQRATTP